jgi:hypothetical protein
MLTFSDRPPETARSAAVQIVRCPASKDIVLQITADNLLGTATHFCNSRTTPCTLPHCPACTEGIPWRWHAYIAAYEWERHRHVLLELTAAGAEPLISYRDEHGTLRGRWIRVTRPNRRPNGRTAIQIRAAKPTDPPPPNAPDVRRALCLLWSIPFTAVHEQAITRGIPALDARGAEIENLLHSPPNPKLPQTPTQPSPDNPTTTEPKTPDTRQTPQPVNAGNNNGDTRR